MIMNMIFKFLFIEPDQPRTSDKSGSDLGQKVSSPY